ncbi:hypothetical protein [Bacillus pseudomycoides]
MEIKYQHSKRTELLKERDIRRDFNRMCNIDHSFEDVINKLETQQCFLSEFLVKDLHEFLKSNHSQKILNEIFHLLKKYDLAAKEEHEKRNEKLMLLIS